MSVTVSPVSYSNPRNGARVEESVPGLTLDGPDVFATLLDCSELDLTVADNVDGDREIEPGTSAASVSLLGTFSFRRDGRSVALAGGSRKLLTLLALRGHPMTRAFVAYTLWPDVSENDASSSLRSALCRLKIQAGDVVGVANVDLQLRPEVSVDLRAATSLAHRLLDTPEIALDGENASVAVHLLSGDVLPEWTDEWVTRDAIEWHQLRLHALEALAGQLARENRFADSSLAALAAVRAEPLRETAHSALIQTFLAEGNQKEALDEYDRFRDLLQIELGVEPSPRISELVGGLRRRRGDS